MFNNFFVRLVALLNILLVSLIFSDFFILTSKTITDVYNYTSEVDSRISITRSYKSILVVGVSGRKYQMPEGNFDIYIDDSSVIRILRSPLFGMNKSFIFLKDGNFFSLEIGYLNSRPVVLVIFICLTLFFCFNFFIGYESKQTTIILIGLSFVTFLGVIMMIT